MPKQNSLSRRGGDQHATKLSRIHTGRDGLALTLPLPQERESAGAPLENSDVVVAVPAFFAHRFGGTRQPSSVVLSKDGRMFLPLLGGEGPG